MEKRPGTIPANGCLMAWSRRSSLRLFAAVSVALLLASAGMLLPIERLIPAFKTWSEQAGPAAVLAYVLLFVAATLLCLPYRPYLLGTMLGMLPDTLVYVALGSAGHLLMDPDAKASPYRWVLLGLGLAATALITRAARPALARIQMEQSRGAA